MKYDDEWFDKHPLEILSPMHPDYDEWLEAREKYKKKRESKNDKFYRIFLTLFLISSIVYAIYSGCTDEDQEDLGSFEVLIDIEGENKYTHLDYSCNLLNFAHIKRDLFSDKVNYDTINGCPKCFKSFYRKR